MAKLTLAQGKALKKKKCKKEKGSARKLGTWCKNFIQQQNDAAPFGKKGKAKKKARKQALAIVNGTCNL